MSPFGSPTTIIRISLFAAHLKNIAQKRELEKKKIQ